MRTLSGHRGGVYALCYVREGVLVSGSGDKSLIIWSKLPECTTYLHGHKLTGITSDIEGIIRLNEREIVSGEQGGDLRMWEIDQGICIRHIEYNIWNYTLTQMKLYMGEVVISYWKGKVMVWGADNNWGHPLRQFTVCDGYSIEFLYNLIYYLEGEDLMMNYNS